MVIFEKEKAEQRIKEGALAYLGTNEAPGNIDALFKAAVRTALAICMRNDISEDMEHAVSVLLGELIKGNAGRPVSAIKRGDVSITYSKGGVDTASRLFAPFIRLGGIKQ